MSKTNSSEPESKLYSQINGFLKEKFEMVKDKHELNQEKLVNAINKYKEKLPKISDSNNEKSETIKMIQEKNEDLKIKRKEIYQNFKDFCKIKKINTINNAKKIKESYLIRKDKINLIYNDYKNFKNEKKGLSKLIKYSNLFLFLGLNFGNFYLSHLRKYYKFKFFRFFFFSGIVCLSLNYYGQTTMSKYVNNKHKDLLVKILSEKE